MTPEGKRRAAPDVRSGELQGRHGGRRSTAASATFAAGAADLPLAQPLHVGANALSLHVDRPGMGRDEVIALSVPVAYRVRADVTAMSDPHPSILIHVEALPGSDVRIADKPVTLDGNGVGTYAIDESAATEGPADESRVVSLDVPYTVASARARAAETGTVSARVAVAPLRVDAPGARAVVEGDHVLLAGRAAKGATVTVDGAAATVARGRHVRGDRSAARRPATVSIEVRSGTAALAPRTVHFAVKRVASLADEAKAFEKQPSVGYDAAHGQPRGQRGTAHRGRRRSDRAARLGAPHALARRRPARLREGTVPGAGRRRAGDCRRARRAPARLRPRRPRRSRRPRAKPSPRSRPTSSFARSDDARARPRASRRRWRERRRGARARPRPSPRARSRSIRPGRATLVVGVPAGASAPTGSTPRGRGSRARPCPRRALRVEWRASAGVAHRYTPRSWTRAGAIYVVERARRGDRDGARRHRALARPDRRRRSRSRGAPVRRHARLSRRRPGDAIARARRRRAMARARRARRPAARRPLPLDDGGVVVRRGPRPRGPRRRGARARADGAPGARRGSLALGARPGRRGRGERRGLDVGAGTRRATRLRRASVAPTEGGAALAGERTLVAIAAGQTTPRGGRPSSRGRARPSRAPSRPAGSGWARRPMRGDERDPRAARSRASELVVTVDAAGRELGRALLAGPSPAGPASTPGASISRPGSRAPLLVDAGRHGRLRDPRGRASGVAALEPERGGATGSVRARCREACPSSSSGRVSSAGGHRRRARRCAAVPSPVSRPSRPASFVVGLPLRHRSVAVGRRGRAHPLVASVRPSTL